MRGGGATKECQGEQRRKGNGTEAEHPQSPHQKCSHGARNGIKGAPAKGRGRREDGGETVQCEIYQTLYSDACLCMGDTCTYVVTDDTDKMLGREVGVCIGFLCSGLLRPCS